MDITHSLRTSDRAKNLIFFNPSICWIIGDYYFLSARAFQRYENMRFVDNDGKTADPELWAPNPFLNPQHPWLTGDGGKLWWSIVDGEVSGKGEDDSRIYIVKFNGQRFNVIKSFRKSIPLQDIRVFRQSMSIDGSNNEVKVVNLIMTGNEYLQSGIRTCKHRCNIISQYDVTIYLDDNNVPEGYEIKKRVSGLCLNLSYHTEKNWGYWSYKGRSYILYSIVPHIRVFAWNDDIADGCFEILNTKDNDEPNIFGKLEDDYKTVINGKNVKGLRVSLSTPAYPFSEEGRYNYISVGHIKVEISFFENLYSTNQKSHPLYKWADKYYDKEKDILHGSFIYFAFIFIFNISEVSYTGNNINDSEKQSFNKIDITHVSPFFMIDNFHPYPLCFPCGFSKNEEKNTYTISYGESDMRCKLLMLSYNSLENILKPVEEYRGSIPYGILSTNGRMTIAS